MGRFCTAGDFRVKTGHDEEDFVRAWRRTGMDMDPPPSREGRWSSVRLLRDLDRPGHFLSFVEWESQEETDLRQAMNEFRSRPDLQAAMDVLREHADFTLLTLEEVVRG